MPVRKKFIKIQDIKIQYLKIETLMLSSKLWKN